MRETLWQAGLSDKGICGHCERERVIRSVQLKGLTYTAHGREWRIPGGTESICRECKARARREGRLAEQD